MKSMYLDQALGQAAEAIGQLDNLTAFDTLPVADIKKKMTKFDIRLDNVFFNYPGFAQKAVDGVSFAIPQGKTLALVGASGSGKTTIILGLVFILIMYLIAVVQ